MDKSVLATRFAQAARRRAKEIRAFGLGSATKSKHEGIVLFPQYCFAELINKAFLYGCLAKASSPVHSMVTLL